MGQISYCQNALCRTGAMSRPGGIVVLNLLGKNLFSELLTRPDERLLWVYSVEKLCFEKSGDFICDLSGITYCRYEGVAEVV